jgi:hypothetical protein
MNRMRCHHVHVSFFLFTAVRSVRSSQGFPLLASTKAVLLASTKALPCLFKIRLNVWRERKKVQRSIFLESTVAFQRSVHRLRYFDRLPRYDSFLHSIFLLLKKTPSSMAHFPGLPRFPCPGHASLSPPVTAWVCGLLRANWIPPQHAHAIHPGSICPLLSHCLLFSQASFRAMATTIDSSQVV